MGFFDRFRGGRPSEEVAKDVKTQEGDLEAASELAQGASEEERQAGIDQVNVEGEKLTALRVEHQAALDAEAGASDADREWAGDIVGSVTGLTSEDQDWATGRALMLREKGASDNQNIVSQIEGELAAE